MSGFSPEYLAQIEDGMKILESASICLDAVERLLEQEPTADLIKNMVLHLAQSAESVRECRDFEAIMPHDSDEMLARYLTLAERAGQWVGSSD